MISICTVTRHTQAGDQTVLAFCSRGNHTHTRHQMEDYLCEMFPGTDFAALNSLPVVWWLADGIWLQTEFRYTIEEVTSVTESQVYHVVECNPGYELRTFDAAGREVTVAEADTFDALFDIMVSMGKWANAYAEPAWLRLDYVGE